MIWTDSSPKGFNQNKLKSRVRPVVTAVAEPLLQITLQLTQKIDIRIRAVVPTNPMRVLTVLWRTTSLKWIQTKSNANKTYGIPD